MHLDALDLLCLAAIVRWEAGSGRALDPEGVLPGMVGEEGRWVPTPREAERLLRHCPGTLEWVEVVLPPLCELLLLDAGDDWSVEALGHVARLVAVREARLSVRMVVLVRDGGLVDTSLTWAQLALAGFPGPDLAVLTR